MLYGWDTVPPPPRCADRPRRPDLATHAQRALACARQGRRHVEHARRQPRREPGAGAKGAWRTRRLRRVQRWRRPRVRHGAAAARAGAAAGHRAALVVHRRRRARGGSRGHARRLDRGLAGHTRPASPLRPARHRDAALRGRRRHRSQASIAEDGPGADVALRNCVLTFDASHIDGFIGSLLPDRKTKLKFNIGKRYVTGSGWQLDRRGQGLREQEGQAARRARAAAGRLRRAPSRRCRCCPAASRARAACTASSRSARASAPCGSTACISGCRASRPRHEPRAERHRPRFRSARRSARCSRASIASGSSPRSIFPTMRRRPTCTSRTSTSASSRPRAVGLAVDAKGVKGGGFLFHDGTSSSTPASWSSSSRGWSSVKAIGLLSTRLPDGSQGYSLLILITAEELQARSSLPMGWRSPASAG